MSTDTERTPESPPSLAEAARYALDMLRRSVPDWGREVTLALRLAALGGVYAERVLAEALAAHEAAPPPVRSDALARQADALAAQVERLQRAVASLHRIYDLAEAVVQDARPMEYAFNPDSYLCEDLEAFEGLRTGLQVEGEALGRLGVAIDEEAADVLGDALREVERLRDGLEVLAEKTAWLARRAADLNPGDAVTGEVAEIARGLGVLLAPGAEPKGEAT